jgi:hypothetical protein
LQAYSVQTKSRDISDISPQDIINMTKAISQHAA